MPAGLGSSPSLPGGSGIIPPAQRPARGVHHWTGTGAARVNARGAAQGLRPPVGAAVEDRTLRPSPRKHGLTLSLRDEQSLRREPWWNAERRAAPAGAAPHRGVRWLELRLSAFRFLFLSCHCEERKRRSNPETRMPNWIASLTLAMTKDFRSCAAMIVTKPAATAGTV